MSSVLYAAGAHTDDATGWQLPSTGTLVAVVLVAVATVVGAWLARRGSGRSALLLAAVSGILLIIAVLDLLPDAWDEAHEAGVPLWAVPVTALASYGVMGAVVRIGCPCKPGRAGGVGAASGLALHRFLEGSTRRIHFDSVTVDAEVGATCSSVTPGPRFLATRTTSPGNSSGQGLGTATSFPPAPQGKPIQMSPDRAADPRLRSLQPATGTPHAARLMAVSGGSQSIGSCS
jgi:ZIP family zinc transporter